MTTKTHRELRRSRLKGLIGTVAATAALAGGAQVLAPAAASAEMANDVPTQCDWFDVLCQIEAGGGGSSSPGVPTGGGSEGQPGDGWGGSPSEPIRIPIGDDSGAVVGYVEVIPVEGFDVDALGNESPHKPLQSRGRDRQGREGHGGRGHGGGRGGRRGK